MALLSRVYFNAVFGALGGLLGWMLYGVFGVFWRASATAGEREQSRSLLAREPLELRAGHAGVAGCCGSRAAWGMASGVVLG